MDTKIGLWLDHKKAIIISIKGKTETVERVFFDTVTQPERSGVSPQKGSFESFQIPADNSRQRALTRHLNQYFDVLISRVCDAKSVLIMGPGEAKIAFKKRMKTSRPNQQISGLITTDSMTENQVRAKVRNHFA